MNRTSEGPSQRWPSGVLPFCGTGEGSATIGRREVRGTDRGSGDPSPGPLNGVGPGGGVMPDRDTLPLLLLGPAALHGQHRMDAVLPEAQVGPDGTQLVEQEVQRRRVRRRLLQRRL